MKGAGIIAALAWILFGITLAIRLIAGDGGLLAAEMLRAAPPETTGLPAADYPGVGEMTAEYLTGRRDTFRYEPAGAAGTDVFQPHEAAHMADCRALIRLDTTVCIACLGIAAVLTAAGLLRRNGRGPFLRGVLWGLRIFLCLAGVLLAWALIDFDGLFVTFHRAAFTNDGWLLNPRTDLLIRLMPENFFIRLGIIGASWAMAGPLLLEIAARILLKRLRQLSVVSCQQDSNAVSDLRGI